VHKGFCFALQEYVGRVPSLTFICVLCTLRTTQNPRSKCNFIRYIDSNTSNNLTTKTLLSHTAELDQFRIDVHDYGESELVDHLKELWRIEVRFFRIFVLFLFVLFCFCLYICARLRRVGAGGSPQRVAAH
jgi:hypothetical protein